MIIEKHRRWIIYLISCLLFIFSQFYRSSIAVISPNLVEELNLDTEELGLISAAFILHGLGWMIKEFFPGGSPEPEIFRIAFVFFGVSLVLTALLYGLTVDVKKNH